MNHALKKLKTVYPPITSHILSCVYFARLWLWRFYYCSEENASFLKSVQTADAKFILGCRRTTSHDNSFNDL